MAVCSRRIRGHVELQGEVKLGLEFLRVRFVVLVTLRKSVSTIRYTTCGTWGKNTFNCMHIVGGSFLIVRCFLARWAVLPQVVDLHV